MSIVDNLDTFLKSIPDRVRIIAVSKTKSPEEILEVYRSGFNTFGENKVQELVKKYGELPKDINWHMIGHLQSNKVKYIAPFIRMIHAVDSLKLLKTIDKEAQKNSRIIDCLFQVRIAREETKYGLSCEEIKTLLASEEFPRLNSIRMTGLMGMATFTNDDDQVRSEFEYLRNCFHTIKTAFFPKIDSFRELSMGMSGDYTIAIEQGSTMIRIGSLIFGKRY